MPFTPRISNPQQQAVADAIAASQLSDRQKEKLWQSIGDEKRLLGTAKMYQKLLPVESARTIWQNRTAGPWEIGEPEPQAPAEEPGIFDWFSRTFGKDIPKGPTLADEDRGFDTLRSVVMGTPQEPTFIGETAQQLKRDIADPSRLFSRDYWLGTTPETESQAFEQATGRPFTGPLPEKIQTPMEAAFTPMIRPELAAPEGTKTRGVLRELGGFTSPAALATVAAIGPVVRGAGAAMVKLSPTAARWLPAAVGTGFGVEMAATAYDYADAAEKAEQAGDTAAAEELRGQAIAAGGTGLLATAGGFMATPKRVGPRPEPPTAPAAGLGPGTSSGPTQPGAAPQGGPIGALRPAGMELPAPPAEPLTARQRFERRTRGTETGALETALPERTVGRGKKKATIPGGRVFVAGEAAKPEAQGPPLKVERSEMGKWVDRVKAEEAEFQAREAMVRSQAERVLKQMPQFGTMAGRAGIAGPIRGLLEKPSFKMPPATTVPRETVGETVEPPPQVERVLPSDLAKPGTGRPPIYGRASHSKVGPHKVLGSFAVVPNSELVTSHGAYLAENPYYPQQYQNRQRASKESDIGIEDIRRRLDPEQLADSYLAKDGAPFILPDKVVLAGNGRSLALRRAYAEKEPGAIRYRQWLIDNAERFNLDRAAIEGMEDPQLVRVYEPANTLSPEEFARISNVDETVQLSPAELASSDATRLTPEMLDQFDAEAGAGILAETNRDFTREYLEKIVAPAELPNFTHEGKINQRGVERVRNAIFAKAYGDSAALAKVTQVPGEDTAVLSQALLRAAPSMVKTQTAIAKGDLFDAPIHKEAARVTGLLANLADRGVAFEHYAAQESLFKTGNELTPVETALGRFMAENSRSPEKIATLLRQYNEVLADAGSPKQTGFFQMNPPTQADVLEAALRRTEAEYETKAGQRRERARRKKADGEGEAKPGSLAEIKEQLAGGPTEGPAPGFTRLYRGRPVPGQQPKKLPEWVGQEIEPVAGRWFASGKDIAGWYIRPEHIGEMKGEMVYVDVPSSDVGKYRVSSASPEVRSFSSDPENEYFLPRELASKAASIKEQLGPELGRATGIERRATGAAQTKRRLRDFTAKYPDEYQIADNADAIWQPGKYGKPGTLYVNSAAQALIRAVINRSAGGLSLGMRINRKGIEAALRNLKSYIKSIDEDGLFAPVTVQNVKMLYAQLDQAYKAHGNVITVAAGSIQGTPRTIGEIKRTVQHEQAHDRMERMKEEVGKVDLVDIQEFYGVGTGAEQSFPQFLAQTAAQNLQRKFKYKATDLTDEVIADLYANDLRRLGLTQSQADELFAHFIELLAKDVGPDAADIVGLIPPRLRDTYEGKYARQTAAEVSNIRPESQWLAGPSRFVSRLREGWARSGLEANPPAKLPAEELREARGGPDGGIDNAGEVLEGLKRFADRISKRTFGKQKPSDNWVIPKPIAAPSELFALMAGLRSPSSFYPNLVPEFVERTNPQTGEVYQLPLRRISRDVFNMAIQAEQKQAGDTAQRDVLIRLAYRQAGKANEVKLSELIDDPDIYDVESLLRKYPDSSKALQDSYLKLRRWHDEERIAIRDAIRAGGGDVSDDWGIGRGFFHHAFDGNFYARDKKTGQPVVFEKGQGAFYRTAKELRKAAGKYVAESGGKITFDDLEPKLWNPKLVGDPRVRMTKAQFIRFKNGLADLGLDWDSINEIAGTTAAFKRGARQASFVKGREQNMPGWMKNKGAVLMYNGGVQRFKQIAPLRPHLENLKVEWQTSADRGEIANLAVWMLDRYIDAVEGRSDWAANAINQAATDLFGAAPYWTERTTGFINGLEAAIKLGPTPISAVVNLFQIPINVMPVLGPEYTWKGLAALVDPTPAGRALREKVIGELQLKEQTSKTETFEAKNIQEFIELMKPDGPADAVRGFIDGVEAASLFFFNSAEYVIRGTAAMGTYKRALSQGYGHEYAIDKARRVITRTAFHLGPADKPYVLRMSRVLQPMALFKSFMIKQLEFMGQTASGTGDPGARFDPRWKEIARLLATIGIFVGIKGFPGGDNIDQIYEWLTGGGAEDVPGSELGPVRSLGENYPRITRGLPGVVADVDITKMTGFADWFMPQQMSLQTLGGPFASDIANLSAIIKAPEGRDKQRALDRFWRGASPSIRRLFQAWEAHFTPEHKISDTTGRTIIQDVTLWERAMVLFGAMPIRMSRRYDAYEVAQRIVEKSRSLKGFYLDEAAKAMEEGDGDAIGHWREEAANQGYPITVPDIRRRLEDMRRDRLQQVERSSPKGPAREELRRRREALDQ